MEQYNVTGMSCAACQARVEKAVSSLEGVTECSVSLLTNSMGVSGDAKAEDIIRAVEKAGYGASPKSVSKSDSQKSYDAEALKDHETPILIRRLATSVLFLIVLMYITMGTHMLGLPLPSVLEGNIMGLTLTQMLLALAVMIVNKKFYTSGFSSLIHGAPNMDTLVALGSSVSFGWSLFVFYKMTAIVTAMGSHEELMQLYHGNLYFESAAMIPALITVGKMLEAMSKGRTTDALKSLMELAPQTATVIAEGKEKEVPVEEISVGDIFVVRPGEAIPVDGIIIEGTTAIDESALTGESVPVDKNPGENVSQATINSFGFIKCRATKVGEDTTLSQIIQMVSDAAATKAPIARIADRISGIFVPGVIAIATVVFIGWMLSGASLAAALERGICVLVISCPCALGLATPVSVMVGNGLAAKSGILFKTGEALETLGKTDVIALDKTGTITYGKMKVCDLVSFEGTGEEELLSHAFSLEKKSEHPISKAIVDMAEERRIEGTDVSDFEAVSGNGLKGRLGDEWIYGGNADYIENFASIGKDQRRMAEDLAKEGKTPLFFAKGNCLLGIIAVSDSLKEDSPEAIASLRKLGLKVVMLTGDNATTANAIAKQAGVDEVVASVLPDGKQQVIRDLQKQGKVAMVGDGINDAPALTAADIGIAVKSGTDVAIESADVVLVNGRISDVCAAVRLSRKTLKNIHENLFWAFFYNMICIPLAAGLLSWKMSPMIGAAAMSISSFTVCMNALRLNAAQIFDGSKDRPLKHTNKPAGSGKDKEDKMEATIKVEGMMCQHCEARVKKALEELDFVAEAIPSHEKDNVVLSLSSELDESALKQAIEDQDYKYIGRE